MPMTRSSFVAPALAFVALAGCSGTSEGPTEGPALGTSKAAVINGAIDKPEKYPATVMIETVVDVAKGLGAGCTGTLISTRVVVTARHCVSNYNESTGTFGADYNKANMHVWYGAEPRGTPDNSVVKVVYPPSTRIDNADFALIVLAKAATPNFAPVRLTKPPKTGASVAVAGYGLSNDGVTSGPTAFHPRYRREGLNILAVGPAGGYLGAKELMLGESICSGDSGGPVYDAASGALLAVTSRGGNGTRPTASQPWLGCVGSKTYNIFTRVDGFADLITTTLAEVGEVPWEEGGTKPPPPTTPPGPAPGEVGATCGVGSDCSTGLCIEYEGKKFCSKACGDKSACPASMDCVGGYCVPGAATPPPTEPPVDDAGTGDPPAADPGETTKKGGCTAAPSHRAPNELAVGLLFGLAALVVRRRR